MTNHSEVPMPEGLGAEISGVAADTADSGLPRPLSAIQDENKTGDNALPTPMDSLSSDEATLGVGASRSPSPLDFITDSIADSDSKRTLPAPMDFAAGVTSDVVAAATQIPSPSPEHTRDYAAKDPKVAGLPTPMDFAAEATSETVEASPTPHDEH